MGSFVLAGGGKELKVATSALSAGELLDVIAYLQQKCPKVKY